MLASKFTQSALMMKTRKPSIEIYLSDDQKWTIRKAAAETRLSISEYCVEMIFKGYVKAPLSADELKMHSSLAGMANNLNQIVKRMHQDKESNGMINEFQEIIKKLNAILDDRKNSNR
jgi:Bacterial mobilisation protein (MobC)